ncbi:MAG: thioredoxin family protein [Sandaracinaceae bacterium]|nr:thioredoxin family protein [Sandaracinaceae bacterium]
MRPDLVNRARLASALLTSCLLVSSASLEACRESPPLRGRAPGTTRAASEPAPAPAGPHLRFEPAPAEGDLVTLVRAHMARAREEGRVPLVYVGASWCEPCQYFHRAAEEGALDGELPRLALLEFDRDRDGDRLDAAGYGSRMIPLFVSPEDDGRASERRIEGSIHGPGSPQQIVPRLRAILPTGAALPSR